MSTTTTVRMDKWLWAARIFKTRSLAADACRLGRVTIDGHPIKASREPKIGDVLLVVKDEITRTFKVLALLHNRVGAGAAKEFVEDLTPPELLARKREPQLPPLLYRPKGAGRPTKRDRRAIKGFLDPI